eukprot:7732656-Alexandrium_andersonii.AAC.1
MAWPPRAPPCQMAQRHHCEATGIGIDTHHLVPEEFAAAARERHLLTDPAGQAVALCQNASR